MGIFEKFKLGFKKSASTFTSGLKEIIVKKEIDDKTLDEIEEFLIKSDKKTLIEELEEKKELSKTKTTVLTKQEERIKSSLQEQEKKIQEMLKNPQSGKNSTETTS